MKKVEVEGGEFMIQSKEGHYAIIPARDRNKVMKLVEQGCDDCINEYIKGLPKDVDYANDGSVGRFFKTIMTTKNLSAAYQAAKNTPKEYTGPKVYVTPDNKLPTTPAREFIQANKSIGVDLKTEQDAFEEMLDEKVQSRGQSYTPNINSNKNNSVEKAIAERNKRYIDKYYGNYSKENIEDVMQIQASLGSLYTGKIDGKFGRNTLIALNNKTKIELLDNSLVDKYYKNYKLSNEDKNVVIELQKFLYENGKLSEEDIDGKFGEKTKQAFYDLKNKQTDFSFDWLKNLSAIDDTRCAAGMCKLYEQSGIDALRIGIKGVDAWNMFSRMNNHGGVPIFNIYDDPAFKGIKTVADLKATTRQVKSKNPTTPDMYQVGDVVGIFYPSSTHHAETLRSKTHNTHVGFVSRVENGVPIITHNIMGKILHQPYNSLSVTWINRPYSSNRSQLYNNRELVNASQNVIDTKVDKLESKLETKLTPERRAVVSNIVSQAHKDAPYMAKDLGSDIDTDWLTNAVIAISGVETGVGLNAKRNKQEISSLRKVAYFAKSIPDSKISLGVGKLKIDSLDGFGKNYLGIKTISDLSDDNKSVSAITYKIIRNYELLNDFKDKNPELGLLEEDIRNLAILGYNRGMSKILQIGKLSDTKNFKEELQSFRNLYQGNSRDISETNFRFLPFIGETLYDLENPEGTETYISKTNRYINTLKD